ncbi:tetratricopeptide repeat protein [Rhizobium sp. CECT 9324]|uniref:tetratricopeptide repeat protein n=1 Tax=Rhizobium sp. CECT 9324 TaxID=2845820 RepID=UPI001E3BA8AB|nr:tetratricopeptide repeat protein [Rhizobium sp. CECT 9324]CAH0339882.1 hypothetical protein RHI9324_01535 [Rhizobium sp. CECT 9324]
MNTNSRPAVVRTFMTHDMTDADIVAVSTGREEEFGRIMAAISRSRSATPGALQHVVLYGSRGFGKSFMMRRVEIALQQTPPDNKPIIFLLLPEEQHNLQKSPHAFLDYITVLLTKTEGDEAFAEAMFQWPKPGEAARRWKESVARLEAALDAELPDGQGLVVVAVENFDSLLATLFANDEDEQRLRDWLFRQKNRVMLLATATGTVDMDYDKPLFQAFEPVRLQPWTTDDCITYFNRKRESENKPPLDGRQEAKARAVAEFIGGTPRLAQLLAEVIETEDALTVAETMNALADRLAEYYRRRIEDLAPLVRGLLDALIRGGEPASQTQLAERVGAAGQSQIARAMSDLQTADIIRGRPAPDSRETLYAVTDRVFAHYYRRRQGSRVAQETPLASILDFLRSFYDRKEQKQQGLRHLLEGRLAEGALFSRLAMEDGTDAKGSYVKQFEYGLSVWLGAATTDLGPTIDWCNQLLQAPEQVLHKCKAYASIASVDSAILACLRAQALYRLGHEEQAETELRNALDEVQDDISATIIVLDALMRFLSIVKDDQTAMAALGFSFVELELGALPALLRCLAHRMFGWSLDEYLHHEDALAHWDRMVKAAREIDDKLQEALARTHWGWSLGALGQHIEALRQLDQGIELAEKFDEQSLLADARRFAGWSLKELGRYEEALAQLDRAIQLSRERGAKYEEAVARQTAATSLSPLGRHDEALAHLREAIRLGNEIGNSFETCWSISYTLDVAAHIAVPGISTMFTDWIFTFQEASDDALPDPRGEISEFTVAAMRAGEWEEFDSVMDRHGEWLTTYEHLFFYRDQGEIIADIADRGGRAKGWHAVSNLLTRVARLQALAPENHRDHTWLSDLMVGFAEKCRDPGLLRDVAGLLTPDLSPEAEQYSALLIDLSNMDEAEDPERLLARMDPDRALLIRLLRDLPDPEPPRPSKSGRRIRR